MRKETKKTEKPVKGDSKHPIVDAFLKAIQIDMEDQKPRKYNHKPR